MTIVRLLSAGLLLAACASGVAQAADNPARGKVLFLQCAACHAVTATAPRKVGPNLFAIVGVKAGTRPGFAYSKALKGSPLVWDEPTLLKFMEKPGKLAPGTSMVFPGIADEAKRRDIVAYLKTVK